MLRQYKIFASALLYTTAFLYPTFLAAGVLLALVLMASDPLDGWQVLGWWGIFYCTMHYPVYMFSARQWGILWGLLIYGATTAYATSTAALLMHGAKKITTHAWLHFSIGMLSVWIWQEYGLMPFKGNPFINPLVVFAAWLPYSYIIIYNQWIGWVLLVLLSIMWAIQLRYGVLIFVSVGLASLCIKPPEEYHQHFCMPHVHEPCRSVEQMRLVLEHCFRHCTTTLIFPESFFESVLDAEHILIKSIKDYATHNPLIILGARRQSSDKTRLHTSLFVLNKNGIVEQFDKIDCLYGAECHPLSTKASVMPGTNKRLALAAVGWNPYLCSELFWARSLKKSPNICLVHDAWLETFWMAELMLLKARLLAVQHNTIIIYCSYRYKALINKQVITFLEE